MPRIPTLTATEQIDDPGRTMPRLPNANATASALSGLGGAVEDAGERLMQQQTNLEDFTTDQKFIQLSQTLDQKRKEITDSQPAGAPTLAKDYEAAQKPMLDTFLQSDVPARLQDHYKVRLATLAQSKGYAAANTELDTRNDYYRTAIDGNAGNLTANLAQDPNGYGTARSSVFDAIDKTSLPPPEKAALKTKYGLQMAQATVDGLIKAGRYDEAQTIADEISGFGRPADGTKPIVPGSHLAEADATMQLTPQERMLYQRHLLNLGGPGGVDNADGTRSTIKDTTFEVDGKTYVIPTVWGGKILEPDAALKRAKTIGLDRFPSYASEEEANARYDQLHSFMEKDTIDKQTRDKRASPSGDYQAPGLEIKKAYETGQTFGKTATENAKPFNSIVVHDSGGDTLQGALATAKGDPSRGGSSFGYHFLIDKDGTIYQEAPLDARTNHVKPPGADQRTTRPDISNEDAIGVSMIGQGNPTPQQVEAGKGLISSLMGDYHISAANVVGHGEIQRDRQSNEGMPLVKAVRGTTDTVNGLSFAQRADFASRTENAIMVDRNKRAAIDSANANSIASRVSSDVNSIANTGQETTLTDEQVRAALGPDAADKWQKDRANARTVFTATGDLDSLPPDQIQKRLVTPADQGGLAPVPGSPDFDQQQANYDAAQKKIKAIQQVRSDDPARAVEKDPVVRQALASYQPDQPASVQALVDARIAAQGRIGIPPAAAAPITQAEVARIRSVLTAPELTTKAGAQKQRQLLQDTVTGIQTLYGPHADAVMTYVLGSVQKDKDLADAAAGVIRKIGLGGKPTPQEAATVDALSDAATAHNAISGALPRSTGEADMWNGAFPQAAAAPSRSAAGGKSDDGPRFSPSRGWAKSDITDLIRDPEGKRQAFDTVYGKGASDFIFDWQRRLFNKGKVASTGP